MLMMLQTSLDAYYSISDLELGLKQQMVYDCIVDFQPCTNKEISVRTGLPINCVTPRTFELREMGLVVPGPELIDGHTKRKCVSWMTKNRTELIRNG